MNTCQCHIKNQISALVNYMYSHYMYIKVIFSSRWIWRYLLHIYRRNMKKCFLNSVLNVIKWKTLKNVQIYIYYLYTYWKATFTLWKEAFPTGFNDIIFDITSNMFHITWYIHILYNILNNGTIRACHIICISVDMLCYIWKDIKYQTRKDFLCFVS